MPGIYGIISKRPKKVNENELERMQKAMDTDISYTTGKYIYADQYIYLGWTCHKDSFSDCLPVMNETEDVVLIYYGENFCDSNEFDQLKRAHHRFDRNNCNYIVHMYEEWGEDFLLRLNGISQGVIIDLKRKKTILFNDRYGILNFYYYESNDAYYFSAETKGILALNNKVRDIDIDSLAEFLKYNFVLDNKTVYRKILKYDSGSYSIFKNCKQVVNNKYFNHAELEKQTILEKEFYIERLKSTMNKVLKRYFKSNDKIGILLQDDLDCLVILANAEYGPGKLLCYTLNYKNIFQDSIFLVKKIANSIAQNVNILEFGDDFIDNFYHILTNSIYFSEGAFNPQSLIELYMYMLARKIAPIHISYCCGTSIFNNERFSNLKTNRMEVISNDLKEIIKSKPDKNEIYESNLNFYFEKGIALENAFRFRLQQSQCNIRLPFLDNDLIKIIYRSPLEALEGNEISIRLCKNNNIDLTEYSKKFKQNLLYKLSGKNKANRDINKLYWRNLQKSSKDKIAVCLKEILLDNKTINRPFFNRNKYEERISKLLDNKNYFSEDINKVLTLELLHRFFID
jgi:asparagine synthase (glutamine-hydrolysing)